MAVGFIVIFSAIFVLAQGSNLLPIEQQSEVPIHSGAPAAVISQGQQSVSQSVGSAYGQDQGLAGARPYWAAPRPSVAAPRPAVSYARPAAVVVPALVVAPIRQPQGVPVPAVVGASQGNVYHGRHHG